MSTEDVIGWIATGLSSLVFAAPASQFINVFKNRLDYEDTPTVLIGTIYCNCLAWYVYGDLIFSTQVKTCSLIGCGLSLLFIIIYLAYEVRKFLTDAILNALIVFTGTWAAYRALTIILADPNIVGKVCIGTSLIYLMCPLYLMYRVYREKNYRLISLVVAILSILGGIGWAIYGFMEKDYYIVCPNLLAVLIAIVQIVVRKTFKTKYPTIEQAAETSTIGIESSGEESTKKPETVDVKIDEESAEEGEKIKAKPVKIVTNKEPKAA